MNSLAAGANLNLKTKMIKSINFSQDEIIKDIINLYVKDGVISCDVTYSKGNFYKNIQEPLHKFDLYPQTSDTVLASSDNLPLKDSCMDSVMFDPPFLATKGKSLLIDDKSNKINKRFTVFPSEKELHCFYERSISEIYRILKPNGVCIIKCQDKVSGGKQYMSHVFIINQAEKLGFYVKDMFILLAKNRIVANWQKKQQHSRKFHCYFIVIVKSKIKIKYT